MAVVTSIILEQTSSSKLSDQWESWTHGKNIKTIA